MAKRKSAARPPAEDRLAQSLERYRAHLSEADFHRLTEAIGRPLPQGLRINRLKADPILAAQKWSAWYGWQLEAVPYCPTGWQVVYAEQRPSQTPEYKLGNYYIQDAASMLPVELFDISAGEAPLILDLAAAPGGKTTHLVDRSGDHGLVVANDSSASRIAALRSVLQDWGAMNVAVTNFSGEMFGTWFPETFDYVLLDAPCSMENLRPDEAHSDRPVSGRERGSLAERQTRLLASAFRALKPGGQLVYSTCTLAPEEDEGVIDALLRLFPEQAVVEAAGDRLLVPAPGLTVNGEIVFNPQVERTLRLWPHLYGTSGFFAARIGKTGSTGANPGADAPWREIENTGFAPLAKDAQAALLAGFHQDYGFDLEAVLTEQHLGLWTRGETVYALPEALFEHFAGLPVQAAGLALGEMGKDGFAPSHELAARFGARFKAGKLRIPLAEVGNWLAGGDLPYAAGIEVPASRVIVIEDERGRLLGRGKALEGRVRNLLPRWLVR